MGLKKRNGVNKAATILWDNSKHYTIFIQLLTILASIIIRYKFMETETER